MLGCTNWSAHGQSTLQVLQRSSMFTCMCHYPRVGGVGGGGGGGHSLCDYGTKYFAWLKFNH